MRKPNYLPLLIWAAVIALLGLLFLLANCGAPAHTTTPASAAPETAPTTPTEAATTPEATTPAATEPATATPSSTATTTLPSPATTSTATETATAAPEPVIVEPELAEGLPTGDVGGNLDITWDTGLEIGDLAYNFTLRDVNGDEHRLSRLLADGPVVLQFGSFT